jgi:protein TonB
MTATTINSFPSLHNWSSPRSWALAIIVVLHLGFFWVLTNGLSISIPHVFDTAPPELIPVNTIPTPPKPKPIDDVKVTPHQNVTVVEPVLKIPVSEEPTTAPYVPEPTPPGDFTNTGDVSPPAPVVVEPRIDSRRGLTEPFYPPAEIRQGHEGTVVLSLHILADGRVGEVKLHSSSGYPKLDESAMREAKRWRFIPGTSDGSPLAMWKQVPITFRLNTVTR